ncbi:hypothetical protein [Rossellomorea aquimaris]|uniref:hypothetical protein n=1 Tax=Rossellomorea aquimaris TaxID=189382 RepID=UPI0024956D28|nr:hypothetical protein [Rossellomorea aquimaris]
MMITENVLNPDGETVASKRFDGNYENQYFFNHYDLRGSVTNIVDAEAKRSLYSEQDSTDCEQTVHESYREHDAVDPFRHYKGPRP